MNQSRSRRFSVADAMALVVAVAAGLAVTRTFGDFTMVRREVSISFRVGPGSWRNNAASTSDTIDLTTAGMMYRPRVRGWVIFGARELLIWPGPTLMALTLVSLGHGLRTSRRLARRPGMAAGVAVMLAAAVALGRWPNLLVGFAWGKASLDWPAWWLEFWFTLPRLAGFAVAVSWLTLALGGRWKAGGGWVDRLGVGLGVGWVGIALIDLVARWCEVMPL